MSELLSFFEFCERLKSEGAYIGDDGHIYRKDGRPLSRRCRNGYYLLRKMYNHHTYHFCEHRVVWYFYNGEFDESLTINHKDFNRENNKIDNLELVTMSENVRYTISSGRQNVPKAEDSGKALFTNKEVQAIRYLKKNGWNTEQLQSLFNVKWGNTLQRVINGARYGSVADASDIISIYPAIVKRTWDIELPKEERIKNALLGLSGETGEFLDIYKKTFYHGKEMDSIHLMLELGDILYYLCVLCIENGIDFSEIMYENMDKLYNRYPDGFSVEKSNNRKEGDI